MNLSKIWIEQCEAARRIEAEFGTQKALAYLIGEKFINYLEAAEDDAESRPEIPAFVAEIARQTEPFDPDDHDDSEDAEMARQDDLRRSAADLLLVELAREWLLDKEHL